MRRFEYDVALSFAGEDRKYAEEVASALNERGVKVFYDAYASSELWGKDLYFYLSEMYTKRARFCLMLISSYYASKAWPSHERKAAQARAISDNTEYILPLRMDDTEVPGLLATTAYLDSRQHSLGRIVELVIEKINYVSEGEYRRHAKTGMKFVNIPKGEYAVDYSEYEFSVYIPHLEELESFWIGVEPVSLAEYGVFLRESGLYVPEPHPLDDARPRTGISCRQAEAYCRWTGLGLPTPSQWLAAFLGPHRGGNFYPGSRGRIATRDSRERRELCKSGEEYFFFNIRVLRYAEQINPETYLDDLAFRCILPA